METKTYNTRLKRKLVDSSQKSRVDWRRTKKNISQVLDFDGSSEEEELEETGEESDDSSVTDGREDQRDETSLPEEDGDERIKKPRFKSKLAMINSDSSSDSDGPGERVNTKRVCVIKEDDSDEAKESEDEQTRTRVKKQKRLEMLKNLVVQKSRGQTTSQEATEERSRDVTPETDFTSQDDDDMSDFIVEDEEENNNDQAEDPTPSYKELFKKHHISMSESFDLSSHLRKVIKAFVINIADETFLITLYDQERRKRYARDMLKSLYYLDERIIGPRLENLTASCRWTKRYKERVNSYPNLYVKTIPAEEMACQACEFHRTCSFLVVLSGQAYDNKTLEFDDFLQDDEQTLVIGAMCARRTEAYHQLRHYKYFLYQRCEPFIDKTKEKSVNEKVKLALSKMEAKSFIGKEIVFLEGYLNEADYFQDERKDSLIS